MLIAFVEPLLIDTAKCILPSPVVDDVPFDELSAKSLFPLAKLIVFNPEIARVTVMVAGPKSIRYKLLVSLGNHFCSSLVGEYVSPLF